MAYNSATDSSVTNGGRHIFARCKKQGTVSFRARSTPQAPTARTELGDGQEVTTGPNGMTTRRDSPNDSSSSLSELFNPANPERQLTDLEEDTIIAECQRILKNRMLEKLARKLVGEGKAPENLSEFDLFLRAGFLGIDLETRGELITYLKRERNSEK